MGLKKWKNCVLVEGEKSASLVARKEDYPNVDANFDNYPVDVRLPKKRTLFGAIKRSIEYGKMGIYSMIYKDGH